MIIPIRGCRSSPRGKQLRGKGTMKNAENKMKMDFSSEYALRFPLFILDPPSVSLTCQLPPVPKMSKLASCKNGKLPNSTLTLSNWRFLLFTSSFGTITQITLISLIHFSLIISDESRQINYHLENLRNLRNHREAVCFFSFQHAPSGRLTRWSRFFWLSFLI